jgi:hypothetical protein
VDFLALMIASFTLPAVTGAVVIAVAGYFAWGPLGGVLGAIVGYALGMWYTARFAGVPLSPQVKGWLSLLLFLGGLTVLAIVTR